MRNVRCRISTDKEIFHLFKLMNNHWQTLAPIKVTFLFFFPKIFNRRYDELPHAALFYKAKFEAKKRSNRLKYGIILRNSSLLLTQIFSFSSQCQVSFSNTFNNSNNLLIYFNMYCIITLRSSCVTVDSFPFC